MPIRRGGRGGGVIIRHTATDTLSEDSAVRPPFLPLFLVLAGGCVLPAAAVGQEVLTPVATGQGVVFVADGAGRWYIPSGTLAAAVREAGVPMCVERVNWQRGLFRPIRDLVNHRNHREQGALLAARVLAYRMEHPADRIVLVGHSAGAAVVLAAAECLPPGSVDRIVLLAPAVSAGYDLGAAFAASREGVDSFNSPRDGVLATYVMAFGTADRKWRPSAGWVGFRSPADDTMTAMLRQHTWRPSDVTRGYFGGHYGPTTKWFLRESVLPLVAPAGVAVVAPGVPVVTTGVEPAAAVVAWDAPATAGPGVPACTRPGLRARIADLLRR
jgi:pimeloyl-ACP methyl ester carboxylesterase